MAQSSLPKAAPEKLVNLDALLVRDGDVFDGSLSLTDYVESLVPLIKDLIAANKLLDLIASLQLNVSHKDKELNTLSTNLTGEMNACSDTIDTIHSSALTLRRKLAATCQEIERSLQELVRRKAAVVKSRDVNERISETKVVLSLCIQVLEVTNKTHELIKQKKYFSALKLIDELTHIHLPKVESFTFAVRIYESVPTLTSMIKNESFDNLLKWLALNLERKLDVIGDAVFDSLYALQHQWASYKESHAGFTPHKLNSPVELALRDPATNDWFHNDDRLQLAMDTVFDAILVYRTLNEADLLSELYHKEWINKYNRVIYPITLATDSSLVRFQSLESLEDYLRKIAAFFVMDKHINTHTRFNLRSNANSNDLWDLYVAKLKPVLLGFLESMPVRSLHELNRFKVVIGNFLQVMEDQNYSKLELYQVLMIIFRDHFIPSVIAEFRDAFLTSIQSDHYMPMVVELQQDYDDVMRVCWYDRNAPFAPQNHPRLPVTLPFSLDYVHYCYGIQDLLDQVFLFLGEYYSHDSNEVNSMIANDIFERVLGDEVGIGICHDMKEFIDKNRLNKEVAAQSYTNLVFYELSILEIGMMINSRLRSETGTGVSNIDANDLLKLAAADRFLKLRKHLESTIYSMVDAKIRDLMEIVDYDDWLPTQRNTEAMFTITDFARFLENLFASIFANLPSQLRTIGLFRTYDFVAQRFLSILYEAPEYNRIAIENFDLDVRYVEELMKKLYAMNGEESSAGGTVSLDSTFTELRQCIDLLKMENYEEFWNSNVVRARRFDRVRMEDAQKLISKMQGEITDDDNNSDMYDTQLIMSSATAALKFAKFSSKFRMNAERDV